MEQPCSWFSLQSMSDLLGAARLCHSHSPSLGVFLAVPPYQTWYPELLLLEATFPALMRRRYMNAVALHDIAPVPDKRILLYRRDYAGASAPMQTVSH